MRSTSDRDARLRVMDEQRLDGAFFFPTLGVGMEQSLKHDLPAAAAAFRAFNRWMDEDWGFHYKERIFAAPYLSLSDPANAVRELEWAVGEGRPDHRHAGRSGDAPSSVTARPPTRCSSRFWTALEESGITARLPLRRHRLQRDPADVGRGRAAQRARQYDHALAASRPFRSADTLSALISNQVLLNEPADFASRSSRAARHGCRQLFKALGKHAGQAPGLYPEHPHDVLRKHVSIAPFYEDDLAGLKDLLGVDKILLGSDWPHTEGLADPLSFIKDLERDGYTEAEQQKVLHDNARLWR